MKLRDYTTADKHLKTLAKFSNKSKKFRTAQLKIATELGNYDEAHSLLLELRGLLPDTDLYYHKAYMLQHQGNLYFS